MSRPTELIIDLNALRHNLAQVRLSAPHSRVLAMVKANAYGHGMIQVAKALHTADALGVASLEEGIALREAGIKLPIVLMEGLFHADELTRASLNNFELVIHDVSQIAALKSAKVKKPFHCWLKINTGMNRLGLHPDVFFEVYNELKRLSSVANPLCLMTHFAEADDLHSKATQDQIKKFEQITEGYEDLRSLCNSAGILAYPKAHADWVRPGLMLYGASPFSGEVGADRGLKPVMTLHSEVMAIHAINQGERVGYGGTFVAERDTRIAIIAAGYGDGYPQQAQNGTPVLVKGEIFPLAGRVSMDMLAVDLKDNNDIKLGDPVTLWGEGLPVETVAKQGLTSPYELLTRITARPERKLMHLSIF